MKRILGIELRRSSALPVGLLFVVASLAILYLLTGPWQNGHAQWTTEWTASAMWQRNLLMFSWPFVLGAGAVQGLRDHRSGVGELMASVPKPRWHRIAVLSAAVGIGLGSGALVTFLVGAVQVLFHGAYFSFGWLPILLVGLLALVASFWAGMAVASLAPYLLTPPLMTAVGFAAVILLLSTPGSGTVADGAVPYRVGLLSPAMNGPSDGFTTVAASVDVGQAVWFAGLGATAFALLAARSVRGRLVAVLPVLVGVAVALPILPADKATAYPVDADAAAPVCTEGPQKVCVTKVNESLLSTVAGPGRAALALLAKLPDAPTSVQQTTVHQPYNGGVRYDPATVPFDTNNYVWGPVNGVMPPTADDLKTAFLAGAGTRTCLGSRDESDQRFVRERAARTVAAAWLAGQYRPLPGSYRRADVDKVALPAWDALRALPEPEQLRRVAALRSAALRCDGDLLDVLASGGGQ
ncbi:hypothetical protein [Amycolatopsis sp. CA-230715]|uniref:hypothetical protein n=1 Tax=Amycolatopsis sp. CA-230715 TaxID=2745196 RepID=UPI001C01445A|nr:hypothetical protein [Amycolatopsis sp. CA-230715]QWF85035.1 hypothetical protein HUW46_08488 [Amycolatopsis sp. CA-230715]